MAWTSPRTWVVSEFVTAALMNTHVRDNMLFLKSNPQIAAVSGGLIQADNRGQSYSGVNVAGTGLSSIAIPADVGAYYVEVWSQNGIGWLGRPGSGYGFIYTLTITDSGAGVVIQSTETVVDNGLQDEQRFMPGYYARSGDIAGAGTTRTISVNLYGMNCLARFYPYTLRIMRSY